MKIGRREHLKQLGLGAVGMLGPELLGDHARANQTPPVTQKGTANAAARRLKAREWPWTSSKPTVENPGIRLVFAGLMIFTYKRTGKGRAGRVVFHRDPHHTLQIIVVSPDGCVKSDMGTIPPKAEIDLVIPQRDYDDVVFFQTGDPDNFNRANWDGKDFRWLLDLEGPEPFNNKDFDRTDRNGFSTKLRVQSGRFYTYQHTNSTFTANVGNLKDPAFHVAKVMACDLWLADEETLELRIPGIPVQSMRNPKKYEIYFLNFPCEMCEQRDFAMSFDAIEGGSTYKFDLMLATKGPNDPTEGLCITIGGAGKRGSDEAPCMGGGFGGGKGFP